MPDPRHDPQASLRATVLTDPGDIPEIEEFWRMLAVERGNPHLTPEWYRIWLHCLGRRSAPAVVVVGTDEAVQGILPLVVSRRPWGALLHFPGGQIGGPFGPLALDLTPAAIAAAAGRELARHGDLWSAAHFDHAEPATGWVEAFGAALPAGHRGVIAGRRHDRVLVAGDACADLERLRAAAARLSDAPSVELVPVATPEAIEELTDATLALPDARRAVTGDERHREMFRGLVEVGTARGWIRAHAIHRDGRLTAVAWDLQLGAQRHRLRVAASADASPDETAACLGAALAQGLASGAREIALGPADADPAWDLTCATRERVSWVIAPAGHPELRLARARAGALAKAAPLVRRLLPR